MEKPSLNPTTKRNTLKQTKDKPNEWRCDCGKLLFKGAFLAGIIEVKCTRCKRMVYLKQFDAYTAENPSFMATLAINGGILSISQGVTDALGFKEEELIGSNFINLLSPNLRLSAEFWLNGLFEMRYTGSPYVSLAVPIKTKNDGTKIFSLLIRLAHLSGQDIFIVLAEMGLEAIDSQEQKVLSKIAQKNRKRRKNWDFIIKSDGTIIDVGCKFNPNHKLDGLIGQSLLDLIIKPDKSLIDSLKIQESFIPEISLSTEGRVARYKACFTPDFLAEPSKPGFIVALVPLDPPPKTNTSQKSA